MLMRNVTRLELAAKPALDLADTFRAGHGREGRLEQPMFLDPLPAAGTGADCDVGVPAPQVAQLVARRQAHGKVGMVHLERAEPPRQPGVGEGMRGRDREQRFVFLAMACERRLDRVESPRQGGNQASAERGQAGASLLAHEQRRAEPLLEALDLIGDGRLGHPQLGRGGGEILRPRSRFEGPDRSQWGEPSHKRHFIRSIYGLCRAFDWRNEARIRTYAFSRWRGRYFPYPAPLVSGPQQERTRAMTYGLSTRVRIEDGPMAQGTASDAERSTAKSWRALDEARRLALIERALNPANDRIDGFPLAL